MKIKVIYYIISAFIVLFISVFFIHQDQNSRLHCRGQVHFVFGDNETLPEFKGVYTFFFDKNNEFLSVNGLFIDTDKTFAVQKVFRVNAEMTEGFSDDFYELKTKSITSLTGDNLPENLALRYILGPVSVISIRKNTRNSYVIKNLYSPVFICHSINAEEH
jgi:hypothetical protein